MPPVADFDRDPLLALHSPEVLSAKSLRWAGYLSTTSVYGDHDGAWVDEDAETRAAVGSPGQLRLAAEQEWLDLESATDCRVQPYVFRLAGIYGPGRSAIDTVVRAARPEAASPAAELTNKADTAAASGANTNANAAATPPSPPRYVSRVHVDDICICCNDRDYLTAFRERLAEEFTLTSSSTDRSCQYLGMTVARLHDGAVQLSMNGFTADLLHQYNMQDAKPVSTPSKQVSLSPRTNAQRRMQNVRR